MLLIDDETSCKITTTGFSLISFEDLTIGSNNKNDKNDINKNLDKLNRKSNFLFRKLCCLK